MTLYAEVAVHCPFPTWQTFTYRVPPDMEVRPGCLVYVPFGPRVLQGVVMEVGVPPYPDAKEIQSLVGDGPLILAHQLALARWLSRRYLTPLFQCLATMMPPGSQQRPLTYFVALGDGPADALSSRQRQVWEYVRARGRAETEEMKKALRMPQAGAVAASLVRKGLLACRYELARPRARPHLVPHVRLLVPAHEARQRAGLRLAGLIDLLAERGPLPLVEACSLLKLKRRHLRPLLEGGVIALEEIPVPRDPLAEIKAPPTAPPTLTSHQAEAAQAIAKALRSGRGGTFLLHGVTGSGKTEVYLAAIEEALRLGKGAIVLVPEISLTPQTVMRFAGRFPGQVTVFHSGLSLGEQFDVWHAVRKGERRVVIGTRSAIFLPMEALGLVVMDEEHEWAYKQQEPPPRYHARLVAQELFRLTSSVLVLGSATPAIESYHRARTGVYRLLRLPHRLHPDGRGGAVVASLPQVEVVDMRRELQEGNRGIFSRRLKEAMAEALEAGEQVILFLNRRGAASFVECFACGHVPACPGCQVAYVFHRVEGRLICHHCNRSRRIPPRCLACGENALRPVGIGTQRVEEEVGQIFPGVRTLRWDRDVTRHWTAHQRLLEAFIKGEAQVLVGTQMLAKGLDLPRVTVTGVVLADIGLYAPDFRSSERVFQVLEQVAGRAGRGPRGGRVIVQTYRPTHPALQALVHHDYEALYRQEMALRQTLRYPPFGELVRITVSHPNPGEAAALATSLTFRLRQKALGRPIDVLGPAPAYPLRLRGRYRWHITIKGEDPNSVLTDLPPSRWWTVDVDPVGGG
jgi:primosomal protein N' (replication factor Y)